VVVAVQAIETGEGEGAAARDPLVYHDRTWHRLGEHSKI
jgi:hypothetical protein